METLEDRRVLAVLVVNNPYDIVGGAPYPGSFRHIMEIANSNGEADTVVFADFLFDSGPVYIGLSGGEAGGEIAITEEESLTIIGPSARTLTIAAAGNSRLFSIDDASDDNLQNISISGVTLSGGNPDNDDREGRGGVIYNKENLNLEEVVITGGFGTVGGGIYSGSGPENEVYLTINRSLIQNNFASGSGGGVYSGPAGDDIGEGDEVAAQRVNISNSTITGNNAGLYGAGVFVSGGMNNRLTSNTITLNYTSTGYAGGVGALNNTPAEEGADPVVSVLVYLNSNIIWGNFGMDGSDVDSSAFETPENGVDPYDSIVTATSGGYNIIGAVGENLLGLDPSTPGDPPEPFATAIGNDGTTMKGIDPPVRRRRKLRHADPRGLRRDHRLLHDLGHQPGDRRCQPLYHGWGRTAGGSTTLGSTLST